MKKTWIWLFVVIFALSGVLAACSKPAASTATEAPVAEAPKEEEKKEDAVVTTPAPELKGELTESETLTDVTYSRSPYLEGKGLPPVEECLPKVPKLANETKADYYEGGAMAVGKYGGTLRMSFTSTNWHPDIFVGMDEALMWSPSILGESVHGNIVEGVEVNEDNTEFTFKLREGLKWSDGEPVTIDDVKFALNDVMFNTTLSTAGPGSTYRDGARGDGDPMTVEYPDEWSFKLKFKESNGHFLLLQAYKGWIGYSDMIKPSHFLKKWHKDYGDMEEIKAEAAKLSLTWNSDEDWVNVFNLKDVTNWELCQEVAEGFPCLYPWMITNFDVNGGATYVRNPYYYKVDAQGQQLPYVDEIKFTYFADQEMYTLSMISGEQDFVRESCTMRNIALYKENEGKGFTVQMFKQHVDQIAAFFNLTYGLQAEAGSVEKNFNEAVNNVEFRRAMCKAINGPEIIDTIYYGYADPAFVTPDNNDLEGANKILDELGYKQGSDGWRTYADGTVIQAYMEYAPTTSAEWSDVNDLMCQNWQRANVKFESKSIDSSLLNNRINANENQLRTAWVHVPLWPSGTQADYSIGFGRLYSQWFDTVGKQGVEPPEWIKQSMQYNADINKAAVGTQECVDAYNSMVQLLQDQVAFIEIGSNFRQPMLFSSDLRNIPKDGFAIACNFSLETLYFENPDQHIF